MTFVAMRSHHFPRIMRTRTIIILGLCSLSLTLLLWIYHSRSQYSQAKSDETLKVLMNKEKESQFIFHQDHVDAKLDEQEVKAPSLSYISDTRPPLTVPRLVKYCNLPDTHIEGQEGLVSKEYKLLSVHVVIRHGDRSPIFKLPSGHASDLDCLTDTSLFRHVPKVQSYTHVMAAGNLKPLPGPFKGWSLYPSDTTCNEGQLTGKGAIQHILNGIHLSERYVHKHQLFSEADWENQVLVHTTETSRTYQSALAFVYGLVPGFDLSKLNLRTSPLVNFCEEKVFGNACFCFGLDSLRNQAEDECRENDEAKKSSEEYREALNYASEVLGIAPSTIPGPTSLMDGLSAHTCHSLPFPCNVRRRCITSKVLESTWRAIDAKSRCLGKNPSYAKFSRALMHGLLFRMARNLKASAENGTNARFHLYSGHDTTVSPLLVALGIHDNVWPGYAHRVVLELYSTQDRKRDLIRVLQNGKVVTGEVAFCQKFIEGDGMCDLDHFLEYLKERNLPGFCKSLQKGDTDSNFLNF